MKEDTKVLFSLIVLNCLLVSVVCLIIGFIFLQVQKANTRTKNQVSLSTFRNSAPLPSTLIKVKSPVIVESSKSNNKTKVKVAKSKLIPTKQEMQLVDKLGRTFLGMHEITFYSTEVCRPGKPCHTATGTTPKHMYTAAVDPRFIPLGTQIFVEGFGILKAEDTGGAIKGNRIDIYIADHAQAIKLGRQKRAVYKLEELL